MAVVFVTRGPGGGRLLIKGISNKESSEGFLLDIWQLPQQLPMEKGKSCIGNPMNGAHKGCHWLLLRTSLTTIKQSRMCVYMRKKKK